MPARLLDEIDLTGSIDPAELAARFGVPAQEIEQAMLRIRRLNPKPGSQYTSHSRSPYILPDVTMIKFVDEYYVALNDYSLPRIRINEEYQNMLLRARGEEHREEPGISGRKDRRRQAAAGADRFPRQDAIGGHQGAD